MKRRLDFEALDRRDVPSGAHLPQVQVDLSNHPQAVAFLEARQAQIEARLQKFEAQAAEQRAEGFDVNYKLLAIRNLRVRLDRMQYRIVQSVMASNPTYSYSNGVVTITPGSGA